MATILTACWCPGVPSSHQPAHVVWNLGPYQQPSLPHTDAVGSVPVTGPTLSSGPGFPFRDCTAYAVRTLGTPHATTKPAHCGTQALPAIYLLDCCSTFQSPFGPRAIDPLVFRPLPAFELVPPGALPITRVPTHKGSGSSAVTSLPVLWPLGTLARVSSRAGDPASPRGSDGLFQ